MAQRIKGLPREDEHIAINYRASPTFQKFHNCPDMFRGICGPIGVGKTVGCEIDVLDKMIGQEPDKQGIRPTRFAFIRSTYPELVSTTMKTWSEWVPPRICPIRITAPITATLTLPLPDGTVVSSEIIFLACDRDEDVKKLKSLECTGIFINEASEINRSIFEMAIGRTLGRYPPKKRVPATWYGVIADTNPPDDEHWWYEYAEVMRPNGYKFFRMPPAVLKQVDQAGKVTYAPNDGRDPLIPKCENVQHQTAGFDYWMKQIPGKTEDWIRVYLMGEYGTVSYGKPVYARYRDTFHATNDEIKPYAGLPIVCGWDFGLCYDDKTEVLTLDGWKLFKDVDETKDMAATRNPATGEMEYTKINFKIDRHYKGEMLEWSGNGVDFCVTPEHRVPYTRRDYPNKVLFAEAQWIADNMTKHLFVDLTSKWTGENKDRSHYLGMDARTFAEFMGIYLSEGSCGKLLDFRVVIYQNERRADFEDILRRTGRRWTWSKTGKEGLWRIYDRELCEYLRFFGKAHDKRVPACVRSMSSDCIKAFIYAYTLGDGHIRTRLNGSVEHTLFTVSKTMAGDMQELAQKVGWDSSVRWSKPQRSVIVENGTARTISNGGGYSVTFKKRASRAELLKENFKKVHYDGRIYCLNVPYHTLYVRRNGHAHWNGNTPTCVIGQLAPNGRLIFLKEFCAEDCGLRMFVMGLVRPYLFNTFPGAQIFSIGDPAGSSRAQTDESTCMEILAECGIPTIPCWTNALMARIEAVSYFLDRTVDGGPGMLVGPGCPKLRKGFAGKYFFKYLTSKKDNQCAGEPDKGPYSHPQDAAQYLALLVLNPERIGMNSSQYGRDIRMASPQSNGAVQGQNVQQVVMDMGGYS